MEIITLSISELLRVFWLTALSFTVAMAFTPLLTDYLYAHKVWKKPRDTAITGEKASVFQQLHAEKHKRHIPTMAGVMIWGVVLVVNVIFNLDRAGTWLPLGIMVAAGLLGLVDDYVNIRWIGGGIKGIRTSLKLAVQLVIAAAGAWWFFSKLGFDMLHVPGLGDYSLGLWYIPLFMLVIVSATNAVNFTDGLDGLAGGLLGIVFTAYSVIALTQGNIPLSAFCGTMVGAVLAYTWFNIYPARFLMGDTGSLATGATLGTVAMLTNTAIPLIVIAGVFVLDALSSVIQILSKRLFGRKVFLVAPFHHHLEAIGWPETKVTMRLWVIGAVMAFVGLIIALFGRG